MSRTGVQGNIEELGRQFQVLSTPLVGADDLDAFNRRIQTAYLQAGVTLLEGITDALRQVAAAVESGAPPSTPPTPSRIQVE